MTTSPSETFLSQVQVERLRTRMAELMPSVLADLAALVRIPSVSAAAFDPRPVADSARAVADLLRGAGMPNVEILTAGADGVVSAPAVVAHRPGREGAPTVLLYAHHDVQPPGEDRAWTSPPFEPTERDGRLFGRGAADDKAGVMTHVAALRCLGEELGASITLFVEGEEEIGSPTFAAFLAEYRERLAADVIVVADSGNWRLGQPALTTSLRGLIDGTIEVRTLDHGVHSGMFGGAVLDAMTAAIRLLDTLWDDRGNLAVAGLVRAEADDLDYPEADLRADAGVLDGVELVGSGRITSRIWTRPSLTITGIDAPSVATASNTLLAGVRVKFTLRVAPDQDPHAAFDALRDHLTARAPWGARVDVRLGEAGHPFSADVNGPVYDASRWALERAWGTAPVHMGMGGSIPFIAELTRVYPDATVLVTGVEDPDSRAHGPDESLHVGEFERGCLAEALLLAALGATDRAGTAPAVAG
jgi:acetylornithine deacetylase/succinyl-diaminopimelate desuccinylase-like protein